MIIVQKAAGLLNEMGVSLRAILSPRDANVRKRFRPALPRLIGCRLLRTALLFCEPENRISTSVSKAPDCEF